MSALTVYQPISCLAAQGLGYTLQPPSQERLALLVMGIIGAKSASPACVAQAMHRRGLTQASAQRCQRRIRRIENDPKLRAARLARC